MVRCCRHSSGSDISLQDSNSFTGRTSTTNRCVPTTMLTVRCRLQACHFSSLHSPCSCVPARSLACEFVMLALPDLDDAQSVPSHEDLSLLIKMHMRTGKAFSGVLRAVVSRAQTAQSPKGRARFCLHQMHSRRRRPSLAKRASARHKPIAASTAQCASGSWLCAP
jgi:hypothetical protein